MEIHEKLQNDSNFEFVDVSDNSSELEPQLLSENLESVNLNISSIDDIANAFNRGDAEILELLTRNRLLPRNRRCIFRTCRRYCKVIRNNDYYLNHCFRCPGCKRTYRITDNTFFEDYNIFIWKRTPILLLLKEYEKRKEKFRNGSVKKKILWNEIKKEFETHGFIIGTEGLDKKFRNMKMTFLKIRDSNRKTNTKGDDVSWEYYKAFSKIFEGEKSLGRSGVHKSITIMGENGMTMKLETLEKIDASQLKSVDMSLDSDSPDPSACTTTKNSKQKYNAFCEEMLKIEEEKLQEAKRLSDVLEDLVKLQRERNIIFANGFKTKS